MNRLSSLKFLIYARLDNRPIYPQSSPTELSRFSFIADSERYSIFEESSDVSCGMLERVIKKVGLAAVLPYIDSGCIFPMLSYFDTPELVSRLLRTGFDAAAVVSGPITSLHNLKNPAWFHFIFHAEETYDMMAFIFGDKSKTDPEPCVMDAILACYGYIPSAHNVWRTITVICETNHSFSLVLDRLTAFLLERGIVPDPETMATVLGAPTFSRSEFSWLFRRLIHSPACPLPELTVGISLEVETLLVDVFTSFQEQDVQLVHRQKQVMAWFLRQKILPNPPEDFKDAILSLSSDPLGNSGTFEQLVRNKGTQSEEIDFVANRDRSSAPPRCGPPSFNFARFVICLSRSILPESMN
jgi:hypothetical protein